jgi:glucokinase
MQPRVVLAVDFGGSKVAATVADLASRRLGSTSVQVDPEASARRTFGRAIEAGKALLEDVAPGSGLVAVGACTFGIPHEDRVELAPTINGWGQLAFGRELRAAFPDAPVRYDTDVKAAAQFESDNGALAGFDPGVYLNLGTGLAAAVVIGGRVLRGTNGAAGEIGYNLRHAADVGLPAPTILEEVVSGRALAEVSASVGAETVFTLAATDPASAARSDAFVAELSMHLVNLVTLVDPARVVVGGGMTGSWSQLGPRLQRAISAHAPFPVEIVPAHHPIDAPLLGALALALAAATEPQPALEPIP